MRLLNTSFCLFNLLILLSLVIGDPTEEAVDDGYIPLRKRFDNGDENELNIVNRNELKMHKKRLETIDGVEIASSYKEYIELALGDLEDRLRKSRAQQIDFVERIKKRTTLFDQIEKEISRRRAYAQNLSEKDKLLRNRLIRNTEMKSALINLADIAGYKLDPSKIQISDTTVNENASTKTELNAKRLSNTLSSLTPVADSLASMNPSINNTYTRYIEMAYSEVESILSTDKQTLIDVIRNIKDNEEKLRDLEKLKIKVDNSLSRLKYLENKLDILIKQYTEIANVLRQLKKTMRNQQQNKNIFQSKTNDKDLNLSNETNLIEKFNLNSNEKEDKVDSSNEQQVSDENSKSLQ
jgi:hypothetical protein